MKRLCILTLAIVCLGVHQQTYAKIRNGYDKEVEKTEIYIRNLHEIAKEVLNTVQRERLNNLLAATYTKAKKLRELHASTQELIEMFRAIVPEIYEEINTIRDSEGNETDVYIKVVDDLGSGLKGATNLSQSVENPNVYTSEYGDYSVSVRLIITGPVLPLLILVHELGHVRYQVPHLAIYCKYYKKYYQYSHTNSNNIGHARHDPSNLSVKRTLKTFRKSWREYTKERKGMAKNKSRKTWAYNKKNTKTANHLHPHQFLAQD